MREVEIPVKDVFVEDLFPMFIDLVSNLLDDDPPLAAFSHTLRDDPALEATVSVHLPMEDAKRVIGRDHLTRHAIYHVFRAICKNFGINLTSLTVYGVDDQKRITSTTISSRESNLEETIRRRERDAAFYGHPRDRRNQASQPRQARR